VFGDYALIQRCQWHKRENVVSYLSKSEQASMRKKLQNAYEQPTYELAMKELKKCRNELALLNQSAVKSLDEGFEAPFLIDFRADPILGPLADRYGSEEVFQAGCRVLGFPPTWGIDGAETVRLIRELRELKQTKAGEE